MVEAEDGYAAEIAHLEAVVAGRAKPTLRMPATLGRLAELYLRDDPDAARVEQSMEMIELAAAQASIGDPLRPKLQHVRVMGERLRQDRDVDERAERAAEWDREAIDSVSDVSPADALAFSADWGDWAWGCERWSEAAEAYQRAVQRIITVFGGLSDGTIDTVCQEYGQANSSTVDDVKLSAIRVGATG